jgi:hypothetical protein
LAQKKATVSNVSKATVDDSIASLRHNFSKRPSPFHLAHITFWLDVLQGPPIGLALPNWVMITITGNRLLEPTDIPIIIRQLIMISWELQYRLGWVKLTLVSYIFSKPVSSNNPFGCSWAIGGVVASWSSHCACASPVEIMRMLPFPIQLTFWKQETVFHLLGSMTQCVLDRWFLAGSASLALST